MTMTDLERELRATLIEAGQRAPVVEDLATRASRPVRRRRARLAAGIAALATAATGVVIAVAAPAEQEFATAPSASPSVPAQAAAQALLGTWTPVDIPGYELNSQLPRSSPRPGLFVPDVTFRPDGRWTGSDGCNGVGGTYQARDDGSIAAKAGRSTLMGCFNVPHVTVLGRAARFEISGRSLRFYAADGRPLGTYQRV